MIGRAAQLLALKNVGQAEGMIAYPSIGDQVKWQAFYKTLDGDSDAKSQADVMNLSPIAQATVWLRKQHTIVVAMAGVTTANVETDYDGSEYGKAPNGVVYHCMQLANLLCKYYIHTFIIISFFNSYFV